MSQSIIHRNHVIDRRRQIERHESTHQIGRQRHSDASRLWISEHYTLQHLAVIDRRGESCNERISSNEHNESRRMAWMALLTRRKIDSNFSARTNPIQLVNFVGRTQCKPKLNERNISIRFCSRRDSKLWILTAERIEWMPANWKRAKNVYASLQCQCQCHGHVYGHDVRRACFCVTTAWSECGYQPNDSIKNFQPKPERLYIQNRVWPSTEKWIFDYIGATR